MSPELLTEEADTQMLELPEWMTPESYAVDTDEQAEEQLLQGIVEVREQLGSFANNS